MLSRYIRWTLHVEPTWAGFVIFTASVWVLAAIAVSVFLLAFTATKGWSLLLIPCVVLYAFYVALKKTKS